MDVKRVVSKEKMPRYLKGKLLLASYSSLEIVLMEFWKMTICILDQFKISNWIKWSKHPYIYYNQHKVIEIVFHISLSLTITCNPYFMPPPPHYYYYCYMLRSMQLQLFIFFSNFLYFCIFFFLFSHKSKDQRKMSSFCPDLGQGQVSFFAPRLIHKMGVLGIDGGFFIFFYF